ncbi:hypothetical protein MSAN_02026200 [Mycena sanguinolenta]|uniref:Uncharacterized protein n=1 Tax=Mycena sanguinolenta TaxID=230812 RepID=A0A8H7CM05_9AGAR|nr:hypothetical protein MSAN_02026200 [Mycena sanguinolenta]
MAQHPPVLDDPRVLLDSALKTSLTRTAFAARPPPPLEADTARPREIHLRPRSAHPHCVSPRAKPAEAGASSTALRGRLHSVLVPARRHCLARKKEDDVLVFVHAKCDVL